MVSAQVRLALQAMRYYRLWIYASNLVLMAGVVIFASVAAALLSDPRRQLLPAAAVSPHQPSVVYAYAALVLQGAVLPVVGCIGALKLSEKLLNSYWILLLVLLAGDMLVGLVWVFRFQKLVAGLVPGLKSRLSEDYGSGIDAEFDAAWDLLQRSARCCGVESPADFNNSNWLANLADHPAWQPPVGSRVQHTSSLASQQQQQQQHQQQQQQQQQRPVGPSVLIGDQRVSRLPLPDSCCKSASFNSDQLRKNGFMSMASEVPPGRKEVYGTGKHRQQLRDYSDRFNERMLREQLLQQQQHQQQLAGNLSLVRPLPVVNVQHGSARYQRRATTVIPSRKDGQHRHHNNQHRHHELSVSDETDELESEEKCGGVWPSVGDISDVHEAGCGEFVLSWLHMTGDTLFVLGYCVLAFVKLCFLAILRYELREMVAKIKILQSEQALNSAAGPIASSGAMPFTHCEMSGIRAVMARSAVPVPPAVVATDVANDQDLTAGQETPTMTAAHSPVPNGEVPSGGGGGLASFGLGGNGLQLPRPRRQSSFSEYNLVNPFVQQQPDNDLFSPPDTPIHLQQQQRTGQPAQNNDNGADSDSGSHCALLPSSCNSTGPPQRRIIKEWDPAETPSSSSTWVQPLQQLQQQQQQHQQQQQQLQHENGWPGRPNGNNNEYHELREIKQTQI